MKRFLYKHYGLFDQAIVYLKTKYRTGQSMKTAFLADVHANLEALVAVRAALAQETPDRVVFLGDILGYGANPNECIEELQKLTSFAVLGNHDQAAANGHPPDEFNPAARAALEWTCAQLTRQSRRYLSLLPLQLELGGLLAVHASPDSPDTWKYIFSTSDAARGFAAFDQQLCFFGHTHKPEVFMERAGATVMPLCSAAVAIQTRCRYLINCGSVGQPRDGDPRACYGLFDSHTGSYRLVRVPYDFLSAQKKILQAGLPAFLAERLAAGR